MAEFLSQISLFPLVLTIGAYQIGLWIQKKGKLPIFNPILIAVLIVIGVLSVTGLDMTVYQTGTSGISWFLTPATVCLAVPLYEQLKLLKKNLPAILAGIAAGTVTSLLCVALFCRLFALGDSLSVSLLPKSITTAMGIVLSQQNGGIPALTTAAIILTGILGNFMGTILCKLFRFRDPITQGVAFGTASHVIGTTRAAQVSELTGAVSSLSLTIAGVLTAVLFPLACMLL